MRFDARTTFRAAATHPALAGLEIGVHPASPEGDVAVWCARIRWPSVRIESSISILSLDERRRAARFISREDKARYVLSRAMLRHLLARSGGSPPEALDVALLPGGKPVLIRDGSISPPHFSISHSVDCIAIAISPRCSVGIDVERVRPLPEMDHLLFDCFTEDEMREMNSLSESDRTLAFFRGWTCKEAVLKALGVGLEWSPQDVEVGLSDEAELLGILGDRRRASRWTLTALQPAPGYAGAVVQRR